MSKIGTRVNSDKNKKAGHQAGSILVHSIKKPESRMTTFEKMEATRKGISKKELEELKKRAGLDYDQLSHILKVARATLIAKKGTERFPAILSEKIMSVADIYSYGYNVFGSEEEFNKWIFQPITALGGKSPYEILDNVYGREEVKHVIGRIEYGVYS
ncbi:MAG: antitoxin Xre/MbcA/ParS toxin-binding domain-containing protein [Chitinophagaceae bacterium]